MITIRDWIATIPEQDKHIAYMDEHSAEKREFLLTGDGWKTYESWGFYLDMAFDLSTITTCDSRQVVTTREDITEEMDETKVNTSGTTTKETYTVSNTKVKAVDTTDIAPLSKQVKADGILLTWDVLRQHCRLPGKLTATLRAVSPEGQVKKSALMVFEVEPAVRATAAQEVSLSEFEQKEMQMGAMVEQVRTRAQDVNAKADAVKAHANAVQANTEIVQTQAETVAAQAAIVAQQSAATESWAQTAAEMAQVVQEETERAVEAAETAVQKADEARVSADRVQRFQEVRDCFVRSPNLLNPDDILNNHHIDTTGEVVENAYTMAVGPIAHHKVDGVCSYVYSVNGQQFISSHNRVALYDSSGALLALQIFRPGAFTFDDTQEPYNRCAYLRFSLSNTEMGENLQIEKRLGEPTELVGGMYLGYTDIVYEPYCATLKLKAEHLPEDMPTKEITVDSELSPTSTNPVQNKVIAEAVGDIDTALDAILALQQSLVGGDGE